MGFSDYLPYIGTGLELFNAYNNNSGRNDYTSALKNSIDADYENQKQLYEYNAKYNADAAAASASRSAAARAAAGVNEARRLAAAGKANKITNKTFGQIKDIYRPYNDSANRLLPVMEGAYGKGVSGLDLLSAYLAKTQGRMGGEKQAYQTQIPIDSFFRGA